MFIWYSRQSYETNKQNKHFPRLLSKHKMYDMKLLPNHSFHRSSESLPGYWIPFMWASNYLRNFLFILELTKIEEHTTETIWFRQVLINHLLHVFLASFLSLLLLHFMHSLKNKIFQRKP